MHYFPIFYDRTHARCLKFLNVKTIYRRPQRSNDVDTSSATFLSCKVALQHLPSALAFCTYLSHFPFQPPESI